MEDKNYNKENEYEKEMEEDLKISDNEILKRTMPSAPENIKNPYVYKLIKRITRLNHKDYVLSVISLETGISDPSTLNHLYSNYMDNDDVTLLNDIFYEYQ